MTELPAGRVTFLFTDIEGSTRLLEEVGEARYAELLGGHRAALRDAFSRHGGVEGRRLARDEAIRLCESPP